MNKMFKFVVNSIIGLSFLLVFLFVVLPLIAAVLPITFAFVVIVAASGLILIPLAWIGSKFGWANFKLEKGKIHVSFPSRK